MLWVFSIDLSATQFSNSSSCLKKFIEPMQQLPAGSMDNVTVAELQLQSTTQQNMPLPVTYQKKQHYQTIVTVM